MKSSHAGSRASRLRPPAALIAGGREGAAWDVEGILARRGYLVVRAHALSGAVALARRVHPDVIILDAAPSDAAGLALSRQLRSDPEVGVSTPLLLATREQPTPRQHRDALRAGTWGFLTAPLGEGAGEEELAATLDTFVLAKREADRAGLESLRDAGSGLYDVRGLAHRARELTLQAFHHHAGLACVALAPATDAEEPFARALASGGRQSDAIGRTGSAEFAVVAPGTDRGGAVKLAERFARLAPGVALRAGYVAVGNVRYTPLEPKNMLAHARRALRVAQAEHAGAWIRAFDEPRR